LVILLLFFFEGNIYLVKRKLALNLGKISLSYFKEDFMPIIKSTGFVLEQLEALNNKYVLANGLFGNQWSNGLFETS
jgi:hypothetical protein